MFIIHRVCICEFAFLLKLICDPKISCHSTFMVTEDMRKAPKFQVTQHAWLAQHCHVEQGGTKPSCFSSHIVKKCPLVIYLLPGFSYFCDFCWWLCWLKTSPKCSAEVLSSVPKCQKAVTWFTEKTQVLSKLPLDTNYKAIGHEFSVNGSITQ